MKFTEIKDLTLAELKKKHLGLGEELFEAKIKNTMGQMANPLEIRHLRRDMARIKTAIVQKQSR